VSDDDPQAAASVRAPSGPEARNGSDAGETASASGRTGAGEFEGSGREAVAAGANWKDAAAPPAGAPLAEGGDDASASALGQTDAGDFQGAGSRTAGLGADRKDAGGSAGAGLSGGEGRADATGAGAALDGPEDDILVGRDGSVGGAVPPGSQDDGTTIEVALGGQDPECMAEALLFASEAPVPERDLRAQLPPGSDIAAILEALRVRYDGRGVRLRKVGRCWALRTAEEYAGLFHRRVVRRRKLSRAAMETLAIIAFHQPVTRGEVEEIRGVALSRGTLQALMDRGWVGLGRRKRSPGRPVTYVATDRFLDHFGLESTRDLPGARELRALGLSQPVDAAPVAAAERESAPSSTDDEQGAGPEPAPE